MAAATKRRLSSPAAAAISEVLDNDDLLREILLRLAFPTTLVRAALVCARWLRVASGAAFLRRFRGLHPPPLLGFYPELSPLQLHSPKFVPMLSLPPELASAARTASAALDAHAGSLRQAFIKDCQDDRLLVVTEFDRGMVLFPLHPLRQAVALSPPRPPISTDRIFYVDVYTLGGGRGGADMCVTRLGVLRLSSQYQRTAVDVYEHGGDGAWRNLASVELQLSVSGACHLPLIDGRLYLVASASAVTAMRLASGVPTDIPTITLPEGLEDKYDGSYKIAVASDRSVLHLVRRKGFQIHVLRHRIDDGSCRGGGDDWSLVDTVCLREVCAGLGLDLPILAGARGGVAGAVTVHAVANDAEFVFLEVGKDVLCVHVKSRAAEKVYTMTVEDECLLRLAGAPGAALASHLSSHGELD